MDKEDKLFIRNLSTRTRRGYLCVRVMRKWNFDGNAPGGDVVYVGLVLADEHGDAIYGQIPQTDVERLGSELQLDQVYTIRKFSVRLSKQTYVPFDAEHMIQMTSFTTVTPSNVPVSRFPSLIYNLTSLRDIKTSGQGANKYIDILGTVVAEGSPRTAYVKGKDRVSVLKELTVTDLSGIEVTVTLWEENVERFHVSTEASDNPPSAVVVLFCGCLPKKIFNKTHLNAGNACCWYINPDIKEAQPFYHRLKNHPVTIVQAAPPTSEGQTSVTHQILEHKTVAEMNAMDPYDFPERGCRCTVAVTAIPEEQDWWYMGCEVCKKRLWNYGGQYHCAPCNCSTAIPLYKLQFEAADESGQARFFCYDVVARQLIRRNCDSLLRSINNAPGLPEQIRRVVGKSFSFTVGLTDQSYRSMEGRVYLVDSCAFRPQPNMPALPSHPAVPTSVSVNVQTQLPNAPVYVGKKVDAETSQSGAALVTQPISEDTDTLDHAPLLSSNQIQTPSVVDNLQKSRYADTPGSVNQTVVHSATEVAPPCSPGQKTADHNKAQISSGKRKGVSVESSHARKRLKYDNDPAKISDDQSPVSPTDSNKHIDAAAAPSEIETEPAYEATKK